jgi:hypothetical protein
LVAAVFVGSGATDVRKAKHVACGLPRLLLQIGGTNIADARAAVKCEEMMPAD